MINVISEKKFFYKQSKKFQIFIDSVDTEGIINSINSINNEYDDILIFKSGTKAELFEKRKIFNSELNNYFSIYNKNIFNVLKKIKEMLYNACIHHEINYDKMFYYISSEYIDSNNSKYWYDSGGIKIPCFTALVILNADENSNIEIDSKKNSIKSGDIILFESGHKIRYNGDMAILSCNIAPLSMLEKQYPQKWIPII